MPKSLLTLVIAMTLMLISMTTISAAQPVFRSLSSVTVVDAHGAKVGDLFTPTELAVDVAQQPVLLTVNRNGFAQTPGSSIFFLTNDCSGAPYLRTGGNPLTSASLFSTAAVSAPGRVLYLLAPGAVPLEDVSFDPGFMGSKFSNINGACVPPNRIDEEPAWYTLAVPVIDLNTLFTPPFSVR